MAAIDVTVWEHVVATEPAAATNLRVIDRTADWPAPPVSFGPRLERERRHRMKAALLAVGPSDIPFLDGVVAADSDLYRDMMPVRSRVTPSSPVLEARDADRR